MINKLERLQLKNLYAYRMMCYDGDKLTRSTLHQLEVMRVHHVQLRENLPNC